MSTPYPDISYWVFPDAVKRATLNGVRISGRLGTESGAFWLGIRGSVARVSAVVFPKGVGVEESPGHWRVNPEVFGTISRWASPRSLTLLGIAHTHIRGVAPRLSWTDRRGGVCVPGILAVVIGNGGEDTDHYRWGWYVYEVDEFRELRRPELTRRVRWSGGENVEIWHANSQDIWQVMDEAP